MITFKQFLKEEKTLLSGLIAGLLEKGEPVQAYALWYKVGGSMWRVSSIDGEKVFISSGGLGSKETWFEFEPEDDEQLSLKKEKGIWTLRGADGGPIVV